MASSRGSDKKNKHPPHCLHRARSGNSRRSRARGHLPAVSIHSFGFALLHLQVDLAPEQPALCACEGISFLGTAPFCVFHVEVQGTKCRKPSELLKEWAETKSAWVSVNLGIKKLLVRFSKSLRLIKQQARCFPGKTSILKQTFTSRSMYRWH